MAESQLKPRARKVKLSNVTKVGNFLIENPGSTIDDIAENLDLTKIQVRSSITAGRKRKKNNESFFKVKTTDKFHRDRKGNSLVILREDIELVMEVGLGRIKQAVEAIEWIRGE
jgi:NACalpha-BTF3-like transcription factor